MELQQCLDTVIFKCAMLEMHISYLWLPEDSWILTLDITYYVYSYLLEANFMTNIFHMLFRINKSKTVTISHLFSRDFYMSVI